MLPQSWIGAPENRVYGWEATSPTDEPGDESRLKGEQVKIFAKKHSMKRTHKLKKTLGWQRRGQRVADPDDQS